MSVNSFPAKLFANFWTVCLFYQVYLARGFIQSHIWVHTPSSLLYYSNMEKCNSIV